MWLERHWQHRTPLSYALYPLSLVFRVLAAIRRSAYALGILRSHRVGVPVLIVGNITVGGTGKTPLVLWLAAFLQRHGMHPGIVSRGYGGGADAPLEVTPAIGTSTAGDEPVLLAARSGCPVWIGRDRVAAARALIKAHPECDVIIADDGLQHYRLARDVEIAVVDGARGLGNGYTLPAGPLREPRARLASVDAVVINASAADKAERPNWYVMRLEGSRFRNLADPQRVALAADFAGKRVVAIAGIGHPPRFFAHLEALGMSFESRAFADHHAFEASDLAFPGADAIVMTEKDAVKCAAFASTLHWVLPVDAVPDPQLGTLVLRKLQTARAK
jgi:tetraacyldisaccharide 4'-kinase